MKYLRSVVTACLVLAVPVLTLAAEPDSTASPQRPNSLEKGARAIQFLSTDWMSSGSVFFKTHRSANHALRLGLSFSASARDADLSMDTTSTAVNTGWEDRNNYSLGVELIAQRYANVLASAHVWYGIGPFFSWSRWEQARQITSVATGAVQIENREEDAWSAGARFILGGEWFASRSLSLCIEYYVSAGYRSSSSEYWTQYDSSNPVLHSDEDGDEVFVNGGAARIGLGIYF